MEIRQLDAFLAAARSGSVSAAARELYVSQPALSRRLAALEAEVGMPLFARTSAGLVLNRAGLRFLPIAHDIHDRLSQGLSVMASLPTGVPDLVVVCPHAQAHIVLAPFIAETGAPIGDVRGYLPAEVYDQLARNNADVAVNTLGPPPGFGRLRLIDAPILVQVPAGHSWAGRETIELAEVVRERVIVQRVGSEVRHVVDQAILDADLAFERAAEASSGPVAQALVAAGRGIAVVVEPPSFGLPSARLVRDGVDVTIPIWASWDPHHYAEAAIRETMERLSAWLGTSLGLGA
ncbi:LysR family transcriptional regulator [Leifsonia sp. NPDC080035]|uniref:LysR family transcriptional regulator n=1 Tax=Leifsonia sp. NPDC080035 TaxID=3143936 RepID=A0AAU7GFR9_9MICO